MNQTPESTTTQRLSLIDELVLALLNEESGYFRQLPGWTLYCAVAGAALAELALDSRIDTDMDSLFLLDEAETGDPALDPILREIAAEPVQQHAQYWIERLAPRADSIIELTLDRLVDLKILDHHDGDFWTLARTGWQKDLYPAAEEGTAVDFVKTRISRVIFNNEVPDPRDAIIVSLMNTCDVLRFIFELDREAEQRIAFISKLDLIGRSIAAAVAEAAHSPLLTSHPLAKTIPTVPLRKFLLNPHTRNGNLPALFADLAEEYGPVFRVRPLIGPPMIFLAGPSTNRWAHRHGRLFLRAKDYFSDMEKVYGAAGLIPALDGADHFRMRKAMLPAWSRGRLEDRLDDLYGYARKHMSGWTVGDSLPAVTMCRHLINAQISPLSVSVESQDLIDDLMKFKARALNTHVARVMPKFMLYTLGMSRSKKSIFALFKRIQEVHTPAQRAGCPRDFADDMLSLHASDSQFLPQANLHFVLSAPLLASMYLGDLLGFAVYAMASRPSLYERIQSEADILFSNSDPDGDALTPSAIDVTDRFMMECMRLYPIVPASIRYVMNSCTVEGYELPVSERVVIAQSASHYMDDLFPDPFSFDIDRYLAPRKEHLTTGYAPYGVGTHKCLGFRWMELQLAVNLLMLAHYFTIRPSRASDKIPISPMPSLSPSKKLKLVIVEQRHELRV